MQALVFTGPEAMEMRDMEPELLLPGESRVRIAAAGICGSDLHAYHGHDPRRVPPMILGHEAAGTVIEGGMTGQRVTMNPLIVCGRCHYCHEGRQNLCSQRTMIGMTRAGAFADSITLPTHCLIPLPDTLSDEHAALTEPAATALHAINRLDRALYRPIAESRALIIGGGAIGMLTALILRQRGVRQLVLADTNPLRRRSVEAEGFETLDPTRQAAQALRFDAVFDCVGCGATRKMATAAVAPGGGIVHVGLQDNVGDLDVRSLTLNEITFLGVYTYSRADLEVTVDLLASGALGSLEWVEFRPLQEGPEAFDSLVNGHSAAPKIVLLP